MRVERGFLRWDSSIISRSIGAIANGRGIKLPVLGTASGNRVRMIRISLKRRRRCVPLGQVAIAVMNQGRSVPR
jgi:hypothetical protein